MSIPVSRPLAACALFVCVAGVLFAVAWKPAPPTPATAPSAATDEMPAPQMAQSQPIAPAPQKTQGGSDLSAFYAGASDGGADSGNAGPDVPAPSDSGPAPIIAPPRVTIVQQQADPSQPARRPIGPASTQPIE
ncbi:hypothetical protein [Novosphingobium sp. 9]|uniref:hypothetical protein n=1 Tax=Novosphingobium sp. 9 TaxID=2025349 RepID=UPI0021B6A05D|nr:hypothetical protein [Novosphingobium sp. 9]